MKLTRRTQRSAHRAPGRPSMGIKPKLVSAAGRNRLGLLGASVAAFSLLTLAGCTPSSLDDVGVTESTTASAKPGAVTSEKSKPSAPKTLLTREQKRAKGSAENYLDMAAFSRKGLIKQLKFEGYSEKASTVAVDALHANWNAQAARKAGEYLGMNNFSRSALRGQLEYEGFTAKQAAHGVKEAY